LDTTATVTVPVLLLLPPLALPLEPLLEHAAATATTANAPPTAASLRILNRDDLINEPPQPVRTFWRAARLPAYCR
jgi:hypothetical protein